MRLLNRLLATLLALAGIALAVLIPVEVVRALLGRRYWLLPWGTWTRTLHTNSWQTGWVRAALIGVAVLGVLLLAGQLKPRRPGLLPLTPRTDRVQAGTTRRSLQQALRRAATDVPGVATARVRARRRSVRVTALTRLRDHSNLDTQVRNQLTGRLDSLQLAQAPRLRVKIRGAVR